jgi:hypothetical protein
MTASQGFFAQEEAVRVAFSGTAPPAESGVRGLLPSSNIAC